MNAFSIALPAALLAAASTQALAVVDSTRGNTQRLEVSAPGAAMKAAQVVLALRDLDNVYEMSTGRNLAVTASGETLQVRYGRRGAVNLKHDGKGSLVSHDGQFELQFRLDANGDPQMVHLTLPANLI